MAMEKIRGKQIVHAHRYSKQYKFRPAASPVITETLKDGRTKVFGGRPGDDMPLPTSTTPKAKPTNSTPKKTPRKKKSKKKKN